MVGIKKWQPGQWNGRTGTRDRGRWMPTHEVCSLCLLNNCGRMWEVQRDGAADAVGGCGRCSGTVLTGSV